MRSILLWVLAVILALGIMVYQRISGPTTSIKGSVEYMGEEVSYKLLRTWGGDTGAKILIETENQNASGYIMYRRFKSYDDWKKLEMNNNGGNLQAILPSLSAAGKMMYRVYLTGDGKEIILNDEAVVLRYKGAVPREILIPHVIFMILSILFSVRAGIEAVAKGKKIILLSFFATITLLAGGLIFGPLVQKFAFDAYWTGWPIGHDLTDNKTAVSFLMWLIALIIIKRNPEKRGWVLAASILQVIIYVIPHSVLGSEIDFTQNP